jgi:hypothetical protein
MTANDVTDRSETGDEHSSHRSIMA